MKPGKPRPEPEEPAAIPPNLLAALLKIETTDAVPVFITRELEAFLTEQGLYRDNMKPEEAWTKLYAMANAAGEPKPPAAS